MHTTVARIDEHGRFDPTFADGGANALDVSSDWDAPLAVAPAPDGSTWIGGTESTAGTTAAGELSTLGMIVHVSRSGVPEMFSGGSRVIQIPFERSSASMESPRCVGSGLERVRRWMSGDAPRVFLDRAR